MKEGGAKYLLIEDNNYDVEIAFFDFEEHGMKPDFKIARNGAEALEYLIDEDGNLRVIPPQAIFLDLHMPKVDGLQFLRKIKSNKQTKDIRVVVFKSSANPHELAECQRLGVHDFIGKPLEYENFICTITTLDK
jgi:two-component system, response regulator